MATEIAQGAQDADTRAQVIEFKINAIPQMHLALLRSDPLAALADAWALVVQSEQFVARLAAEGVITGRTLEIATRRLEGLERELEGLWSTVVGREAVTRARELVHQWAAENPIESMATRVSTVDLLAKFASGSGLTSLRAAPAQLYDTVQDLLARLDYLVAVLPKDARWQAELLIERDLERITRRVTRAAVDEGLAVIMSAENPSQLERAVEQAIGAALRRSLHELPTAGVWPARGMQGADVPSSPAEAESFGARIAREEADRVSCIEQVLPRVSPPHFVSGPQILQSELWLLPLLLGFIFGAAAIGLFFLGWRVGRRSHGKTS